MNDLERVRAAVGAPPDDAAAEALARRRLDALISGRSAGRRPRRGRPSLALALALALVLGVGAVAVSALLPGRSGSPAPASAARACTTTKPSSPHACLFALSALADRQPPGGSGEVAYQRNLFVEAVKRFGPPGNQNPARFQSLAGARSVFQIQRAVTEEVWIAPDGSGRTAYGPQQRAAPSSAWDAAAWRAAGAPPLARLLPWSPGLRPRVLTFGPGGVDQLFLGNSNLDLVLPARAPLSVLPQEPPALTAWLRRAAWRQRTTALDRRRCPASLRGCGAGLRRNILNTFGTDVTSFLRYPATPPRLRAALLQVLARVPGARLLGLTRDPRHRRAAAIHLPASMNDGLDVIAFDPRSSRLLAEGMAAAGGALDAIRWGHVYGLETGRVGRVGERP